MSLFAVVALSNPDAVGRAVADAYPGDFRFPVATGHWLVNSIGTSQDVSRRIGLDAVAGLDAPAGIVYQIGGYFGRANPQIWEWLTINSGRAGI